MQTNSRATHWNANRSQLLSAIIMRRWLSSQIITKNIRLVTEEPRTFEKDEKTLR